MSSSPQHTGAESRREGTATDQSLSQCYESKPGAPPHLRFWLFEIVLENLDPSVITLDTLKVYFRSEASFGGSLDEDRCSFDEDTGKAIITFIEADVTHRVLRRKEHMIGSMNVTIKAGKEQPIRVQNNKCLVIYKQHEIDKEDLTLLIKAKWNHTFPGIKIPGFDMEFNADHSAALVTFTQPVHNMAELIEKISGKLLGSEVSAKLVNRTHSIMVENLPPKIDNDYLSLLFDSLEYPAYKVEQVKHDGTAIVHLKATEYVDSICDLARRGELQLKKAALTCWPFLPEFHSVNSENAHHHTVVNQHNTKLSFPVHTGPFSSIEIEGAFQVKFFFRPNLVVIPYKANLLGAKVDVIVSPANTTLTAEGGIAQKLAEAAGPSYVNNCKTYIDKKGPLTLGDTMNALSGNLPKPIRGVVHAICQPTNDLSQAQIEVMLQEVVFKSLKMADEQSEAASVALPSVWGTNNVPDVVAECLLRAACKYNEHTRSSKRTSNLKEIHITSVSEKMNEQMITCLTQWVHKLSPPDQAVIPPPSPRHLPQEKVPFMLQTQDHHNTRERMTKPPSSPPVLITQSTQNVNEITPQVMSETSSVTKVQDSSHGVPHTGATQTSQLWLKTSEDVNLYIHQGSIENQSTEAIVNVTFRSVLRNDGTSKHILNKAGREVEEELSKLIKAKGLPKEGQCIHTSAGGCLPRVYYIIHVVAPTVDTVPMDRLVNTLINILAYANTKLKVNSITLPFFVTDNKENEERLCKACIDGVLYYSRSLPANNRHLLEVHLVHPKASTVMTMGSFFKTNAVNMTLITGTGMQLIQDCLSDNGTSSRSTFAMNTASPALDREVKLHRPPESRKVKWMHLHTNEGLSVLLRHANIVNFEADAVVCSVDQNAAIMTAAGKGMWQEYDDYFQSHAPLRDGQVLRTSAGNMTPRVQHILHVKCPDYQPGCDFVSSLRPAFLQCLTSANDHHAASISLPPLGLDTRGFTVKDTATAAYGAILDFSHGIRNKSTRCINLLHTDSTIMDEIQAAFRQLIEDQLNGKVRFCSQMFIKEEGVLQSTQPAISPERRSKSD